MSTSPLADVKAGVRIVTNRELDKSITDARRLSNTLINEFKNEFKELTNEQFSFETDLAFERISKNKSRFKGGDIIFNSNSVGLGIILDLPTSLIDVLYEQPDEEITTDLDITNKFGEDETLLDNIEFREALNEMLVFSTPRGKIADIERPYMRTELGLATLSDGNIDKIIINMNNDVLPQKIKEVEPITMDLDMFGKKKVKGLQETQINASKLEPLLHEGNEGVLVVGIDKGRLPDYNF